MRTFFSFSDAWKWLESVELSRFDMICWDLTWARPWAGSRVMGPRYERVSEHPQLALDQSKLHLDSNWTRQFRGTSNLWSVEGILWHFSAPKEIKALLHFASFCSLVSDTLLQEGAVGIAITWKRGINIGFLGACPAEVGRWAEPSKPGYPRPMTYLLLGHVKYQVISHLCTFFHVLCSYFSIHVHVC